MKTKKKIQEKQKPELTEEEMDLVLFILQASGDNWTISRANKEHTDIEENTIRPGDNYFREVVPYTNGDRISVKTAAEKLNVLKQDPDGYQKLLEQHKSYREAELEHRAQVFLNMAKRSSNQ